MAIRYQEYFDRSKCLAYLLSDMLLQLLSLYGLLVSIKAIKWYSTNLWFMGSLTQTLWYCSEMLLSMVTFIEQMLYFGVKPDFDHKTFDGYLNSQLLAYASFCKKGLWSQGKTWRRVCFCLQYLLPTLEHLHFSTSKIFSRKKLQILKLKPK